MDIKYQNNQHKNTLLETAINSNLVSGFTQPAKVINNPSVLDFGMPTPIKNVTATNDNNIDGLIYRKAWQSGTVSFSFPDSIDDYESSYHLRSQHASSFQTFNATQQEVTRKWLLNISNTNFYSVAQDLNPIQLTNAADRDATIRLAMSNVPYTAFAYYPTNAVEAGDAWFNKQRYNQPVLGTYAYYTFGHELGHSFGLKHGHEVGGVRNVAMNADRDSMEFTIMTYRSYVGHDLNALPYYTNESGGFAQTLMMYDIAALQHIYNGARFDYNSDDTIYTFSTTTGEMFVNGVSQGKPFTNRIFRTIWDGNGVDTYDFSNYTTNLSVDLTPGMWSDLDLNGNFQQAKLSAGIGGITKYARGHVFNALLYLGDLRSLIENAKGGIGNDILTGNQANNLLNGGNGNDSLIGSLGDDTLDGEQGSDRLEGGTGNDTYNIDNTADVVVEASNAGTDTVNSTITYVLPLNVENLVLRGDSQLEATGNTARNLLTGNSGNNLLNGNSGNDTLIGGSGDDTLIGGLGSDSLTGGIGQDSFRFNSPGEGRDTITDFNLSEDRLEVVATAFNIPIGVLASASFVIGTAATNSEHRFIYNNINGNFLFDQDGNGSQVALQLAKLPASLNLTSSQIVAI